MEMYADEVIDMETLKTVGNMDLRKIVSKITVSKDREVTIHLRDFSAG